MRSVAVHFREFPRGAQPPLPLKSQSMSLIIFRISELLQQAGPPVAAIVIVILAVLLTIIIVAVVLYRKGYFRKY